MHKVWSILFGVIMTAAAGLFVVAPFAGWSLPRNVSSFGDRVDNLYFLILYITGFFFILTEAILVYNMYRFSGPDAARPQYVHGNHLLEMSWTAVPAVVLLLVAFLQIRTWEDIKYQSRMPDPEQIFDVSARQFEWRMRYPSPEGLDQLLGYWKGGKQGAVMTWSHVPQIDDVHVVNEIHTWEGANVRLYLNTKDVLHSFYLPNLRLKQDALPGKTIPVWFRATETNTVYDEKTRTWVDGYDPQSKQQGQSSHIWDLACAELCGWGHYKMRGRLFVHKDKPDYLKWLQHAQAEQNRSQPTETMTTAAR